MDTLKAKILISGIIKLKTGLHIGGSKGDIQIGEIDNNVIKTAQGVPYIPGSSLKGKLRSIAEQSTDFKHSDVDRTTGICISIEHPIGRVFGVGATKDSKPTLLTVRDSFMTDNYREKLRNRTDEFENLEKTLDYTISKHENVINRKTGGTQQGGLRELERVPAGVEFEFSMVLNIYNKNDINKNFNVLHTAMKMLEDDYLGGSGSRGYGQIEFKDIKISLKTKEMYASDNPDPTPVCSNETINFEFPYDDVKKML